MKKIMKLAYKKILAFVLVFVMLTGTVGTIGNVKAAEPTEIEFNAIDAVNWWHPSDGENAYVLFLKADQELTSSYYTGVKYEVSDGTNVNNYEFNVVSINEGMFNMRIPYEALPNPNEMKASGKTYILTFKAGNIVSATNTTVDIKTDFSIVIKDGSVLGILDTIHTDVTYIAGAKKMINIWPAPAPALTAGNGYYHKVVSGQLRYGDGSATQIAKIEGIYHFAGEDYYYMPLPDAVHNSMKTGSIVVFDNVIVQDAVDTSRLVRLPNLCYQYTENATPCWQVVDEPKDITYTAMDLKFYSSNNGENKNYWDMYFDTDANVPGTEWKTIFADVKATVGDQPIDLSVKKANGDRQLNVFISDTTTLPIPPAMGTVLTIHKGKYKDTADTCGIEIKNDYSLTWDGENWSTKPLVQSNKVTIKDIMTSGYNQELNRWNVYVTVDGTIPGEDFGFNFTGLKCCVNDKEISLPEVYKYNDNTLFFYIVDSELPSDFKGNTKIVLKAGTTAFDSNTNPIELVEDFTIYANEYAWRTDKFCEPVNAKVTGVAGFPLSMEDAWSMTFALDSDVPSEGIAWQTYYRGPAVLIDGNEYQLDLQKTENVNQVAIYEPSLNNKDVKDGTEVTIQAGVYTSSTTRDAIKITEDYTVVFNRTYGEYGYDNWRVTLADTKVEGDVNGDKEAKANDIIRLVKYLSEEAQDILVNRNGSDINKDGVIDKKDIVALRKVLVERLSYVDSEDGMPTGVPYYNNTDKIIRMANVCPEPKDFKKYKEAGFNTLNSELVAPVKNNESPANQEKVTSYLDEAEKYGLDVLLFSDVLDTLVKLNDKIEENEGYKNSWKDIINEIVDVYSKYPAFKGFVISDELAIKYLENYTTVVNYLKETYPNLILRLPMLPSYAYDDEKQKGSLTTNEKLNKEDAYKDYVRKFSAPLGCFTYDNYSLFHASNKYQVDDDWFNNLKWVSDVAKESNLYTGVTIQTCAKASSKNRYAPTQKSDIGFQIYTAMAFGMQEFGYYTYGNHPGDTQSEDSISENTDVYAAVQSVNRELATFEHVFKTFTWNQTLELASGATNSATNDGNLTSVQSTSMASYVGCMRDEEGYYGYMVANAEGPRTSTNTNGRVTLTFNKATHAQVYYNGKCETKELTDKKLTVNLNVGEGAFVIPYIAK